MKTIGSYFLQGLLVAFTVFSCEKEFIPDTIDLEEELVLEAYIEGGDRPTPPLVILTRSVPFFQELDAGQLSQLFVHDAEIRVSNGSKEVILQEICLNDLNEQQKILFRQITGRTVESNDLDFCLYTDLSFQIMGQLGESYDLVINSGIHHLEASTTIPDTIGLANLRFDLPPGEPSDTLRRLLCRINDPEDPENYYRYFTGVNGSSLLAPTNSVIDDNFFNGQSFEFPLPKAEPADADFGSADFGLFTVGDTVEIKWASIDRSHYDFWSSLEFAVSNQGPFSTYTRVNSNVSGGLGFWGGLSAKYYQLVVEQ